MKVCFHFRSVKRLKQAKGDVSNRLTGGDNIYIILAMIAIRSHLNISNQFAEIDSTSSVRPIVKAKDSS